MARAASRRRQLRRLDEKGATYGISYSNTKEQAAPGTSGKSLVPDCGTSDADGDAPPGCRLRPPRIFLEAEAALDVSDSG